MEQVPAIDLQGRHLPFSRLRLHAKLLRGVCVFVLAAILVAGLWPFHAPRNDVTWLGSGQGVFFGDYGSIVSSGVFKARGSKVDASCSLEIWLQPAVLDDSSTILAFYGPENDHVPFALRQSLGDLVLMRTSLNQLRRTRSAKLYVDDLFSQRKRVFVTITSGEEGTAIYADGALVKTSSTFKLSSQDLTGQLILGNAPVTTDNWSGQVKSLAIYSRDLTAAEVSQHFENWSKNEPSGMATNAGVVALYAFNEDSGNAVHNLVDSATDLVIPKRFFVLHEQFLERPWSEFYGGWSYWGNVAINIAGFIPLGVVFCLYCSLLRRFEYPVAVTIALGFAVSLTIEVGQAFLPTRNSGMTDLVTNTLGTAIGALVYKCTPAQNLLAKAARYTMEQNVKVAMEL